MSVAAAAPPKVLPHDEWLAARKALLAQEKAFTHARNALAAARRELPWERVDNTYLFDGPSGVTTLPQMFEGRGQLIVYHFMFPPGDDVGCPHCSFWADNFDPVIVHMNHRDITFAVVSRAPRDKLAAYQKRMGWRFNWYSSGGTSFNYDYGASFTPEQVASGQPLFNYGTLQPGREDREGISVFAKDETGAVFHTYSTHGRGIDLMNTAYNFIDLTPKGRDEAQGNQHWVRRRDEYAD
jgi:predicted dithiol-disulfide oxidoreductase (DUF899 family)